jgi:hypothetical protein
MAEIGRKKQERAMQVKVRFRPSIDELIGAVEEDVSISRRAPRRESAGEGAEFFWHPGEKSSDGSSSTEVLSHFLVPQTSRRSAAFWKELGLPALGDRIQMVVSSTPRRSVGTLSDPRRHTQSVEKVLTVDASEIERPVRARLSDKPLYDAEAFALSETLTSLRRALSRLSPQSDEAVTRLVHLTDLLRKVSGVLDQGEVSHADGLPSMSGAGSMLVGGGMGLTPKELEDLRMGLRLLAERSTWPTAVAHLHRLTKSLGGGDDV